MKRFWALVTLVVATEVCVGMSDKRIRCIIQFVADITRDRRMVPPVVVVEVMYRFKVLIAIQTCIVRHLINLEFPDLYLSGGGGLVEFPEGILASCISFSEFGSLTVFKSVSRSLVSLSLAVAQHHSL